MQDLEEKLLVYRLETTQDAEAFSTLYSYYYPAIYRFIKFRVASADIAEDIASEVFLKLWNYVTERRRITHFRGLAYRITRNTIIDHYRTSKPTIPLEEAIMLEPVTDDLSAMVGAVIEHDVVAKALARLKPDDTEIIVLFYIEQLSVKEIATVLNKRSGAVRVHLHRAREALRLKIFGA